jgi:hypothetical protein
MDILEAKSFLATFNKSTKATRVQIPFNEIIVKDYRFDTTKLGYLGKHKIVVPVNCSYYLSQSLNKHYKENLNPGSEKKLLVIVKTLWLRENQLDSSEDSRNQIRSDMNRNYMDIGTCIADLEIYSCSSNVYKPLVKIKDNFSYFPYNRNNVWEFLLMPFDSMFNNLSQLDIHTALTKRKEFSFYSIDSAYRSRFNKKILNQINFPKGVYQTFQDFLDNRVSNTDFKISKGQITDEIYTKENQLLLNSWGYSDGQDIYINIGFNLYKLIRQNNSWDFIGATYITRKTTTMILPTPGSGSIPITQSRNKIEYRPLQVNMENGDIY